MTLREFLTVIGGEMVGLKNRPVEPTYYEADKNAIRAYREEDLDREIYMVEAVGKNKFVVIFKLEV